MIGRSLSANVLLAAVLSGLLISTVSCGDFQDSASGAPNQSGLSEAELVDQAGGPEATPADHQDGHHSLDPTLAALMLAATESPRESRSVTLGWDPSASEGVLGYKVHLIAVSTEIEQIIDVGAATSLAVPLKIGESYGFTVTAYNSSMESQALPYMLFQVD